MMKIAQKIELDMQGLIEQGAINVVALGDSVTHGALAPDEFSYETAYWNRLKKKMNARRSFMPINMIDSGINGTTAAASLARLERDVFCHHPDLVIICFGLNDVNGTLEEYLSSLKGIFEQCRERGVEAIFMTPNMLNTYVAEDTPPQFLEYAAVTAEYQNSGRMDTYMTEARKLALEMKVPVCDCYEKWKQMQKNGTDTTKLLVNRINHPTAEMHELFAEALYQIIFTK